MIIPVPLGEQYFIVPRNTSEKEIKEKIQSKQKLMSKIVSVSLALVGLILWTLTKTSLQDLYQTIYQPVPFLFKIAPITSIFLGVVFYFFLQKLRDKDVDYASVKTQNGQLKITPIASHKNDMYIIAVIIIAVAVIALTFILPIFSLTSSISDSVPQ